MTQNFPHVVPNVDDLNEMYLDLNLENCVIMNEDGTLSEFQPVYFTDSTQIIENNQLQHITQPSFIATSPAQGNLNEEIITFFAILTENGESHQYLDQVETIGQATHLPIAIEQQQASQPSLSGGDVQVQKVSSPALDKVVVENREIRKNVKMLVILKNGEQHLITFMMPEETFTVQELLEQVGIPFEPDTNIQCVPNPGVNIDYLVTVGVNLSVSPSEIVKAAQNSINETK